MCRHSFSLDFSGRQIFFYRTLEAGLEWQGGVTGYSNSFLFNVMLFMRNLIIGILIIVLAVAGGIFAKVKFFGEGPVASRTKEIMANQEAIHEGDIIFQTSESAQSKAIQLATHSPYSHCGIIYKKGNSFYVYEAIQPVSITPLEQWISRGKNGECVIKRLKGADSLLTADVLSSMKEAGSSFARRNYDVYFEWSDDRIYCSELVWKIYDRGAHIQLCKPAKLRNFDLSHPQVKQKLKERYGNNIPLNETVISPADIFNSALLYTIKRN
jgi:hypothetical protein